MRKIKRTWDQYGGLCNRCKGPNDPYMVEFSLWKEVIPVKERKTLICLECFEKALGRELKFEDFLHEGVRDRNGKLTDHWGGLLPINYGIFGFHVLEFLKNR